MKIVIAMDSFKGSMTSLQAGYAAEQGIRKRFPDAETVVLPLADGGEGTEEAILRCLGGEYVTIPIHQPLENVIRHGSYVLLPDKTTAVMEMAGTCGYLKENFPWYASTYSMGEMIRHAVKIGVKKLIIGLGGSRTTECGIGLMFALGYRFLDAKGHDLLPKLSSLEKVERIVTDSVRPGLKELDVTVLSDVTNPLCGPNGSAFVFGKQKGLKDEELGPVDASMLHFAQVVEQQVMTLKMRTADALPVHERPCTGAGGGMGFALMACFPNAEFVNGCEYINRLTGLRDHLKGARWFLTGEGCMDSQTMMGKAPMIAATAAMEAGALTFGMVGVKGNGWQACRKHFDEAGNRISGCFSRIYEISVAGQSPEYSMIPEVAMKNMEDACSCLARAERTPGRGV